MPRLEAAAATADEGVLDLAARHLRGEILDLPLRFVLIIDESLQPRGVLKYSAGRCAPLRPSV